MDNKPKQSGESESGKTYDSYAGFKQASEYLQFQGVSRENGKLILEPFEIETI